MTRIGRLFFTGCLVAHALPAAARQPPQEVVVFQRNKDGYDTYRIPALVRSGKETLLAFAEGRKAGGGDSGDIDIVLKRSMDGGRTWAALQVVADAGPHTYSNPCPVVDRDTGRIWLPFNWNHGENSVVQNKRGSGQGIREVFLCFSDDEGATWSKPKNITQAVKRKGWTWYATGPGCGIQLRDGRLVIPCNHRVEGKNDKNSISHVIYSDDHGKSWQIGGDVPEERTNEAQVVELDNGALLLNMRSHHGKNLRAVSLSRDRGETWSKVAFDETLFDPTCQASIIGLPEQPDNRSRIAFANPASSKARENLTIRLSYDDGNTWPVSRQVYSGGSGYSSLVALPEGQLGCLYEKDRFKRLVFIRLGLDWLEK